MIYELRGIAFHGIHDMPCLSPETDPETIVSPHTGNLQSPLNSYKPQERHFTPVRCLS